MTDSKTTTNPSSPTPTTTSGQLDRTGWLVIQCFENQADAAAGCDADEIHVVPHFGPEHTLSHALCWRHPVREVGDARIVVHNVGQ